LLNDLIIGAPFGNYLHWEGVTSTVGSYTLKFRAGLWGRLVRVVKTVRYDPKTETWTNCLGLPNPGIRSLSPNQVHGRILSIYGFNAPEWAELFWRATVLEPEAIELNVSCPNVERVEPADWLPDWDLSEYKGPLLIVKLPPVGWEYSARYFYDRGVRTFHFCNTYLCPEGGKSGKSLKPYSLAALSEGRRWLGNKVRLIGGGGIDSVEDVKDYLRAGADHVSVASMLFFPWKWRRVREIRDFMCRTKKGRH
jgi:dihydroorotate dehydrogenase